MSSTVPGVFAELVAIGNVEQAVLSTIQVWLDTYLEAIERQNGLPEQTLPRPPTSESYYGDVDFAAWVQDLLPSVVVVVHPVGQPELSKSVGYGQWYDVEIGALCTFDDTTGSTARKIAGLYGAALSGVILQRGGMGGLVGRTRLVVAPDVVLPSPDIRILALCKATYHMWVDSIVSDNAGPALPAPQPEGQPYLDWPTVKSTYVQLVGEPDTAPLPTPNVQDNTPGPFPDVNLDG